MLQLIEAEALKEHCVDWLEQVVEQQVALVTTRDDHAAAKLVSVSWTREESEDSSGRVSVEIVVPMEVAWES